MFDLLPTLLTALTVALLVLTSLSSVTAQDNLRALSVLSVTSDGSCFDLFPVVRNCTLPALLYLKLSAPLIRTPPFVVLESGLVDTSILGTTNATDRTSVSFTLRLQGYALPMIGEPLSIFLYDSRTQNRSTALVAGATIAPIPVPYLSGVSGCEDGPTGTFNCYVDRDVLQFRGTGLSIFNDITSYAIVIGSASGIISRSSLGGVQPVNDTHATLWLNLTYAAVLQPWMFDGRVLPLTLNLRYYSPVRGRQTRFLIGGSVSVSFAPMPPRQPSLLPRHPDPSLHRRLALHRVLAGHQPTPRPWPQPLLRQHHTEQAGWRCGQHSALRPPA